MYFDWAKKLHQFFVEITLSILDQCSLFWANVH